MTLSPWSSPIYNPIPGNGKFSLISNESYLLLLNARRESFSFKKRKHEERGGWKFCNPLSRLSFQPIYLSLNSLVNTRRCYPQRMVMQSANTRVKEILPIQRRRRQPRWCNWKKKSQWSLLGYFQFRKINLRSVIKRKYIYLKKKQAV